MQGSWLKCPDNGIFAWFEPTTSIESLLWKKILIVAVISQLDSFLI